MQINIKGCQTVTFGDGKSISIEVEPIFWASGTTTYHIYINGKGYIVDNIGDDHLIITDNF